MMFASAGPSPGQTCGLVLIFAVLVQSICVAITFLYFTNELQQEVVPPSLGENEMVAGEMQCLLRNCGTDFL